MDSKTETEISRRRVDWMDRWMKVTGQAVDMTRGAQQRIKGLEWPIKLGPHGLPMIKRSHERRK